MISEKDTTGEPKDEAKLAIIGHLLIRDRATGEVLLNRRDAIPPTEEDDE